MYISFSNDEYWARNELIYFYLYTVKKPIQHWRLIFKGPCDHMRASCVHPRTSQNMAGRFINARVSMGVSTVHAIEIRGTRKTLNRRIAWPSSTLHALLMRIAFLHFIKSRSAVQRASQNLQIVNFLNKNLTTYVVEPILSECVKISKLKIEGFDGSFSGRRNERRENALDNEAYNLFQYCVAMKISHW